MPRILVIVFAVGLCLSAAGAPAADDKIRFVRAPRPEYPADAIERHLTGKGFFALHIRANGSVERVETVKSIGHRSLDAAAVAAFRQWTFARYNAPWTLGIPIRYVDGPVRIDEPMKRPAAPGCLPLLTMFSGAQ